MSMIRSNSQIRPEAQHGKIGGLMVISYKDVFFPHLFYEKREIKLEKNGEKGIQT